MLGHCFQDSHGQTEDVVSGRHIALEPLDIDQISQPCQPCALVAQAPIYPTSDLDLISN
jgi:hypothetical protein